MNLKDWMKLEEDEKTVTLIHPKGHKMTIYSYALPKIQREQLKRLKFARGGKVGARTDDVLDSGNDGMNEYGISEQGSDVRTANKQPTQRGHDAHMRNAKAEAKGRAEIEKTVKPKMKGLAKGGAVAHYDEGPPNGTISQDDAQPAAQPAPAPTPDVPIVKAPEPNYAQAGLGNQANATLQGIQQGQAGLETQRNVDAKQAQLMQPIEQEAVDRANAISQHQARSNQMINDATNDFRAYNDKNPLNEDAYRENMSTERKVGTAIGLALGGMASAFGGHNYAFDFLNKQIDRNIDAQKQRFENQKTVYGAYDKLFQDDKISSELARASMAEIYDRKAKQVALSLGTPQAWANYQKLSADFAAKSMDARNAASSMATQKLLNGQEVMPGAKPQGQLPTGTGANATQPQQKHPLQESILAPDADQKLRNIQFTLQARKQPEDYGPLNAEYTQAVNADASLKNINKAYQDLMKITDEGGAPLRGFLQAKGTVSGLAGVAGGIFGHPEAGEAADAALNGVSTDLMRRHAAAKSNLLTALSAATKGTNLGSGDLNHLVNENTPMYGDENKTRAEQLRTLRKTVVDHLNKGYLKKHGLLNPKIESND